MSFKSIRSAGRSIVPPETVEATRVLITDAIGCALAGSAAPLNAEIVERHARWGGAPEATVLVYGQRLPAPTAAWLNAALIHSHDFDDSHDFCRVHVFVTILPAILATAESTGRPLSGRALLTALAGASEISLALPFRSLNKFIRGGCPRGYSVQSAQQQAVQRSWI